MGHHTAGGAAACRSIATTRLAETGLQQHSMRALAGDIDPEVGAASQLA
jgi:hypothetical protein